jgi:anaerobic magnesium-protoporphyrin IX monomethyl ester cyclase
MRILLINPPSSGILKAVGIHFPPLGLLYLAAYLEKEGHRVKIADLAVRKKEDELEFETYDMVGISTDTTRHRQALRLANRAKQSGCTVVMGGPHPCYVDEEILKTGKVDFVVQGEGEITLSELAATLGGKDRVIDSVQGISFLSKGEVVRTAPRPFIEDLDRLPLPARHLVDLEDYRKTKFGDRPITSLITSRGCPGRCTFCSASNFFGTRWRTRSVEAVLDELEEIYHRHHFRAVAFVDDTLTFSPQRVAKLCRGIVERGLDLWWWSFSRVDSIVKSEDMVKEMARAGARAVYIGIESSNPAVLEEFGKKTGIWDAGKAVGILRRNGIEVHASYILGGFHDTAKSIHETIRFAKKLDTNVAQFSILTPYPGTALNRRVKDRLIRWRSPWSFFDAQHLVFKHDHLSFIRLEWLLLKANLLYYMRSKRGIQDIWRHLKKHGLSFGTVFRLFKEYFWR